MYHFVKVLIALFVCQFFKTKNCCSPRRLGSKLFCYYYFAPTFFRRSSKFLLVKESCLACALENEQFFHCQSSFELLPNATLAINNSYFQLFKTLSQMKNE
jgi:hypothetical protein